MVSTRATAVTVGVFFLITHVTSVLAAFVFFGPVLADPDYVVGTSSDSGLLLGGVLEVILALAVVGTSVALYPVVRRVSHGFAIGYVALRTLEAAVILLGATAIMTVATLHSAAASSETPQSFIPRSTVVEGLYSWAFIIGPGLICPVNTIVLAIVLYRSQLVTRFIPVLGFVGAPLVFALNLTKVFGISDQLPEWAALGVVPLFAWEISLAIFLITRGFRAAATLRLEPWLEASTSRRPKDIRANRR